MNCCVVRLDGSVHIGTITSTQFGPSLLVYDTTGKLSEQPACNQAITSVTFKLYDEPPRTARAVNTLLCTQAWPDTNPRVTSMGKFDAASNRWVAFGCYNAARIYEQPGNVWYVLDDGIDERRAADRDAGGQGNPAMPGIWC